MPDTCQWIFGDPPRHLYCGHPCEIGKPYCPEHDRVAHRAGKELDPDAKRLIEELCR